MQTLVQIITQAVADIPALPMQARGDASNAWLAATLESGDYEQARPLIQSYVALRVRQYHDQSSFIKIFCDGCDVASVLNRAAEGVKLIENSAAFWFEHVMQNDAMTPRDFWNEQIVRDELQLLTASARRNSHFGIERKALKLRASIRIN